MKTYLAILAVAVAVSFSAMAVSASDVQGAKVVTVTTKSTDVYLSIANGRNCLMENAQGKPGLLACDRAKRLGSGEETSHFILSFCKVVSACLITALTPLRE